MAPSPPRRRHSPCREVLDTSRPARFCQALPFLPGFLPGRHKVRPPHIQSRPTRPVVMREALLGTRVVWSFVWRASVVPHRPHGTGMSPSRSAAFGSTTCCAMFPHRPDEGATLIFDSSQGHTAAFTEVKRHALGREVVGPKEREDDSSEYFSLDVPVYLVP